MNRPRPRQQKWFPAVRRMGLNVVVVWFGSDRAGNSTTLPSWHLQWQHHVHATMGELKVLAGTGERPRRLVQRSAVHGQRPRHSSRDGPPAEGLGGSANRDLETISQVSLDPQHRQYRVFGDHKVILIATRSRSGACGSDDLTPLA